jgi:hypothetical protein
VPGFECEKVIETIKPSIHYKGQMIQMGQVIVGTPEAHGKNVEQPKFKYEKGGEIIGGGER